ncbi:hypothetical protein [Nostoc sp. 'Peltigera malacea cyanobiont' DB3992]|uniref:hypothetical protein n=1 Tax=Nostoc sp. 'Peltigera malacea cyanobiont' DB3992 TaxID=1206980 RepID=UPI00211DDCBF|nr:hypothetical protein [Nostoc sp. 'Peltigera malacea cyanobiont' DB3992]
MRDRVSLETVSGSLAFGIGSMSWKVDTTQKKAAWSLYVELVTRIAVEPLEVDQGLVREAMNSLYSLFGTTREVLKAAGPDVGASRDSVGGIAIAYGGRYAIAVLIKETFVEELYNRLTEAKYKVWYDKKELDWGDMKKIVKIPRLL